MKKLAKVLSLILKEILGIITDLIILSILQLKSIYFARRLILRGNIFPLESNTIFCLLKDASMNLPKIQKRRIKYTHKIS